MPSHRTTEPKPVSIVSLSIVSLEARVEFDLLLRQIERIIAEYGLNTVQYQTLLVLARHEQITLTGKLCVSDVSDKLGLRRHHMSEVLAKLEKSKFIRRQKSRHDQRVVYIELYPHVPAVIEEIAEKEKELLFNIKQSLNLILNRYADPE